MRWDHDRQPARHMESPGVLFFRVVVMLSCLILVPLAAIFGSAFPELVKTQLVDRIKSLAGIEHESQPAAPIPASPTSSKPAVAAAEAPRWNTDEATPAWQPGVTPATAHQVEYSAPASAPTLPGATPTTEVRAVDHFTEIQQKLRTLGASHYALESVGQAGNMYRFHCTMTAPGNGRVQPFEAIDSDPLQAMAKVLAQVEACRNNSPPSPGGFERR